MEENIEAQDNGTSTDEVVKQHLPGRESVIEDSPSQHSRTFLHMDLPGPPRIINEQPAEDDGKIITPEERAENEVFLGSSNFNNSLKSLVAAVTAFETLEPELAVAHLESALDSTQAAQFHYNRGLEVSADSELSESWRDPLRDLDLSRVFKEWQEKGLLAKSEFVDIPYKEPAEEVYAVQSSKRLQTLLDRTREIEQHLAQIQDQEGHEPDKLRKQLVEVISTVSDALIASRVVIPLNTADDHTGDAV